MPDAAPELPLPGITPPPPVRRWRVVMADGSANVVEAPAFRVEWGAVVFAGAALTVAAYAPGTWRVVEVVA